MTSAAIYARVSPGPGRRRTRRSRRETAALRAHAQQLGLDVPQEWVFEDEGHSGATLIRPALERLRDLVASAGIDVVLCYSPDRLARKFAYQALLIEEFTRAGTRAEFIKGPRGDSPEDQLLAGVPGHVRRVREGVRSWNATGEARPTAPAPGRSTCSPAPPSATATSPRASTPAPPTRSSSTRPRWSPSCSAATPTRAPPSPRLARWLSGQDVPTRTGKHRWDRPVVWGMPRNPACTGRAVFGKTMIVHESPALNRVARSRGRSTPRASKTVERPREQQTEIAVPAIVSQDTSGRVTHRLAGNKRFATRNSKAPSLPRGLAACAGCGYGYYRTPGPHHQQEDLLLPVPGLG